MTKFTIIYTGYKYYIKHLLDDKCDISIKVSVAMFGKPCLVKSLLLDPLNSPDALLSF